MTMPEPEALTRQELEKTARLANLGLSPQRLARFVPQLDYLLEQIETLATLQKPGPCPEPVVAPVESDEPLEGLSHQEAFSSAKLEGEYVRVPRTIAPRHEK